MTTSCAIWDSDASDYTSCFKYSILDVIYPLALLAGSVLYLTSRYVTYRSRSSLATMTELDGPMSDDYCSGAKAKRFDFERLKRRFNAKVLMWQVAPTNWDKTLRFAEFVVLLAQLSISVQTMLAKGAQVGLVIRFALYIHLFGLCLLRLVLSEFTVVTREKSSRSLFKHSALLYNLITVTDVLRLASTLKAEPFEATPVFQIVLTITILDVILLVVVYFMRFQNGFAADIWYTKLDARPCMEPISSVFSTLTFSWANDLFKYASNRSLKEEDVWGLVKNDYSINIISNFKKIDHIPTTSIFLRLLRSFKRIFLYQCLCGSLASVMTLGPSILLKAFLEYVANQQGRSTARAWYMIILMFLMKVFESVLNSFSLYLGKRIDIRLRTILINEIYCKSLSRKLSSRKNVGSIINLMSSDAYNIGLTIGYINTIPTSIFMISLAVALLYHNLGWSAFVGAAVMVVLIPLNHRLASTVGWHQKEVLETTDKRISQLNEVFNNIRTIKNFAWEEKFYASVMNTRGLEISTLKRKSWFWSLQGLLSSITPTLITFGAFFCFTQVEGKQLTASVAFTSLTLFNLLRQPLIDLAAWSSDIYQALISFRRIQRFLLEEDTAKYEMLDESVAAPGKIGFQHANFSWGENLFLLKDISIDFKPGKLNVIVGRTGSGKSSLLLALLGEMQLTNQGHIYLPGAVPRDMAPLDEDTKLTDTVAYCAQSAWLINDTVKNNILFNSEYDPVRYAAVVKACGLKEDLKILSEDTQIGESGVVLSGGQKQRLSLARAIYSRSKYVLLDDCLSAVDSHTSLWIYENCLTGELMRNRTCILVSHNVSLTMTKADWVVMLSEGTVAAQGEVGDLVARGKLSAETFFSPSGDENKNGGATEEVEVDVGARRSSITGVRLTVPEYKNDGSVPLRAYASYFKSFGSLGVWAFIFVLYAVSQTVFISQTLWLRQWTSTEKGADSANGLFYIGVYLFIGIMFSTLSTARVYYVSLKGLDASNSIFAKVLIRILGARSRFFDSTPKGRIMNRFSKDIQSVDQELIRYGETTLMYLIHCISTIIMICFVTPKFLFFVVFISAFYASLGKVYLALSRELKRLDSITRSPLFSHFQETLSGIATIRAFADELTYIEDNLVKLDQNNKTYFYLWLANRWLSVRTDAVGAFILLLSGSFIIWNVKNLDAGLAGIALTYAMTFNSYAVWLIRAYVSVEMSMNSVERLDEYATVEQEAAYNLPSDKLIKKSWPQKGDIEVRNLALRYSRELPPVIKDVSFKINSNEKIAVVGRTGAGKSTIISACFRFLEADAGGQIVIDGIDIKYVGLKKLRRSISIIPQDPALFHGTVGSNLDPFDEFTPKEIENALVKVNLLKLTDSPHAFINKEVQENGANFSQGQKQLLCLARAILKNSKILLLDEATSSIDHDTDNFIQETIRDSFAGNTVITIAHRLNSIIDYDRVLVLDKGRVVEFDSPAALLADQESLFFKLCRNTGEIDSLVSKANSRIGLQAEWTH